MNSAAPKWKKLGHLFAPGDHQLPFDCPQYAQSPQALVCDGFVRVFFSTREREPASGKFLSHVAFADFDWELKTVLRVCDQPVLPLGRIGCFDEHGIFPINVIRVGERVYGYTCGWSRRKAVSVETGIGLVISENDGQTFERLGDGPILTATLHEPCLVGDGFVKRFGDRFYMWYIYGLPWRKYETAKEPERIYKIAFATSENGIDWEKAGGSQLIENSLGDDECQALPTVVEDRGRYHMYFCYRYATDFRCNADRAYRLGYAFSDDLIHWTRDDSSVGICRANASGAWDSDMMCYPHVFRHDEKLFLLYNGNEFGRHGFGIAVAE